MPFDITYPDVVLDLIRSREIIRKPENWCQGRAHLGNAHCIVGALRAAGVDLSPFNQFLENGTLPVHLKRGQMPDAAWFERQALLMLDPESNGLVYEWNDAPDRTHAEVLQLMDLAIELAMADGSR